MTDMLIYVPDNLDEWGLYENYPLENYTFRNTFDRLEMLFMVSRLIEVPFINRDHIDDDGYVKLKAKYLQNIVPSYLDYLNYLEEAKIILVDKHYIKGKKSRGYRLREPYRSSPGLKEIPIGLDTFLYKKIRNFEVDCRIHDSVKIKYPGLAKWLNSNLKFNLEVSSSIIKQIHLIRINEQKAVYRYMFHQLQTPRTPSHKERKWYDATLRPIYDYKFGLLTLHRQRWFANVDDTVNRLHSSITCLKSELRYCLTYDGKELVSIDIKNSQPYFSILLLNPAFYEYTSTLSEIYMKEVKGKKRERQEKINLTNIPNPPIKLQSFSSLYKSISNKSSYNALITILLSEYLAGIQGIKGGLDKVADIAKYIEHASKGTLYEYIGEALKSSEVAVPEDRKELKAIVFLTLFTDNRFIAHPDAEPKRVFAEIFPTISKVFSLIKRGTSNDLPILLQQIESTIFLDHVAKRISEERPQLPIFTIHDSILTTIGNEGYVATIIKEECAKIVGVSPEVGIEYYTAGDRQVKIEALKAKVQRLDNEYIHSI